MKDEAIIGCILGTAVGDALGLPYEGLSPERATRLFPKRASYHFILGRGMVSDDTEHTCFVAEALLLPPLLSIPAIRPGI
jgi:ADP-ribosylglycohydrolase